jgi:hypothetical protein
MEFHRCLGLTAEGLGGFRSQTQAGAKDKGKNKMAL